MSDILRIKTNHGIITNEHTEAQKLPVDERYQVAIEWACIQLEELLGAPDFQRISDKMNEGEGLSPAETRAVMSTLRGEDSGNEIGGGSDRNLKLSRLIKQVSRDFNIPLIGNSAKSTVSALDVVAAAALRFRSRTQSVIPASRDRLRKTMNEHNRNTRERYAALDLAGKLCASFPSLTRDEAEEIVAALGNE